MVPNYLMIDHLWKMLLWNSYCCRVWWHLPQSQHSGGRNRRMLQILGKPDWLESFRSAELCKENLSQITSEQQTWILTSISFPTFFFLPEVRTKTEYVLGKVLPGGSVVPPLVLLICRNTKEYDLWCRIWGIFWDISLISDWLITIKNPFSHSLC